MKRSWKFYGIVLGVALILSGVTWLATADPYLEYDLSGFTHYDQPTLNQLTLGIETPPILGGLVFDFALTGVLLSDATAIVFVPGSRFKGRYGSSETYIMMGCSIDTSIGFSPFISLRLSFPVFGGWISSGGV